jgi:hypothetical protein
VEGMVRLIEQKDSFNHEEHGRHGKSQRRKALTITGTTKNKENPVIPANAGIQYVHPARSAVSLGFVVIFGILNKTDYYLSIILLYSDQIAI